MQRRSDLARTRRSGWFTSPGPLCYDRVVKPSKWIPALGVLALVTATPGQPLASPSRQNLAQAGSESLPFIADDYETALAQARARKVPLFVESWAPW